MLYDIHVTFNQEAFAWKAISNKSFYIKQIGYEILLQVECMHKDSHLLLMPLELMLFCGHNGLKVMPIKFSRALHFSLKQFYLI